MSLEIFLKLDGVVGGTRNYQHKGWADLLSWHWALATGAANDALPCAGMNRLTVKKLVGPESPAIVRLFVEQTLIPSAEISAIPQVGKREKAQQYVSLAMEDVRVTDIRTDGDAEDNVFTETVSLQFGKIRYETFNHAVGDPNATVVNTDPKEIFEFRWDMEHNRQWPRE
jgi:type VI protein secretion system component Hcp